LPIAVLKRLIKKENAMLTLRSLREKIEKLEREKADLLAELEYLIEKAEIKAHSISRKNHQN
jgi:uncharacterized protein (UPF0335 family)